MSEPSPTEALFVDFTDMPEDFFVAMLARVEAAEPAPESYVQQHTSEPTCFCGPVQVGTLGVWTHRVVEP